MGSQTADQNGMYAFHLLELWSYWTEVHQLFTQCSQIIADELTEIGIAIFHYV